MSADAPFLPLELDPLIAEAKQRARRRRLIVVAVIVVAAAAGAILAARSSSRTPALSSLEAATRDRVQMVFAGSSPAVTLAGAGRGAIWLTTDEGRTWRRSPGNYWTAATATIPASFPDFVDHRHGWIVTRSPHDGPRLERTVDGGRTWRLLPPLPGTRPAYPGASFSFHPEVNNVSFVSPTVGFVDVTPSVSPFRPLLYATDDGGSTWHARALPTDAGFVSFNDARHGFANTGSTVYSTSDGGRTWTVLSRDPKLGTPAVFGRTLVAEDSDYDHRQLSFSVSRDGGSTWSARRAPAYGSASVVSARTWVVIGSTRIYVTTSAGRSWRVVRPVNLPRHWQLQQGGFTSARTGWTIFIPARRALATLSAHKLGNAGAAHGVLMRTTDGGRHWVPAGPPKAKGRG